ncbi:unnamed protein product [Cunninghamella echinulata]
MISTSTSSTSSSTSSSSSSSSLSFHSKPMTTMATTTVLNHPNHHHQLKQPLTISIPPPTHPALYGQENNKTMIPFDLCRSKKLDLIDRLAETSADIIDSIWQPQPQQQQQQQQQQQHNDDKQIKVVCTKGFIYEILKRSKTTYSNLQVCLFYLFRVKHVVLLHMANQQQKQNNNNDNSNNNKKRMDDMISCGRRMFLASLMVASKYLQDKNYRNRAWSRISGLSLNEINAAEFTFLKLINYNLYISKETFDQWYSLLHTYLQKPKLPQFYHYTSLPSPMSPTSPLYHFHHHHRHPMMLTITSSSPHPHSQQQQQQQQQHYVSPSSSSSLCYPSPPYNNNDHPCHSQFGKKRSLDHENVFSQKKRQHTSTCNKV